MSGNEPKFPCDLCGRQWTTKTGLGIHIRQVHTLERPYKCQLCDKSFASRKNLNQHNSVHSGIKPHQCGICERKFSQRSHLQKHGATDIAKPKTHKNFAAKEKSFKCSLCDKSCSSSWNLGIHEKAHYRNKGFMTGNCLTICDELAPGDTKFPCKYCPFSSRRKRCLTIHAKTFHGFEKCASFPCVFCKQEFVRKDRFYEHLRKHVGERPYFCNRCPASFSTNKHLSRHKLGHIYYPQQKTGTDRAPRIKCYFCSKRFLRKDVLSRYMRQHTGERPHKCPKCDKTFGRVDAIKTHIKGAHSNVRPFKCSVCGKCFKFKGKLTRHRQNVHSLKTK